MVCPLLALEEEMVATFETDFGLKAIAINSQNGGISDAVIRKLTNGEYQVILISPEMLQSRRFSDKLLRNPLFTRRVLSMVVDEAHCLSHWGADFRKLYETLGDIRPYLPPGTPVIALTATLTARVRRDIYSKLKFTKGSSRFENVGNDRPNVSIIVRACHHAQNTFKDLDFIIPARITNPGDIPKTYVYIENIQTGADIVDHLNQLIEERKTTDVAATPVINVVRPFNATMSSGYRRTAMEEFRKGTIRIMVCTDAAGMGCNIPDIDLVVQWKLPGKLSNFIQRAGRAARGRGRTGIAVLLVESSAFMNVPPSSDAEPSPPAKTASGKARKKGKSRKKDLLKMGKQYGKAHGMERGGPKKSHDKLPSGKQPPLDVEAADEGLSVFVQSTTCRRKIWARVYEAEDKLTAPTVPCCDICIPALFDRCRPKSKHTKSLPVKPKRGEPVAAVQPKLEDWRAMVAKRDHANAHFSPSALLDDATIVSLSSHGDLTHDALTQLLCTSWIWWGRYGDELGKFLSSLKIPFVPLLDILKEKPPAVSSKATGKKRQHEDEEESGDKDAVAGPSSTSNLNPTLLTAPTPAAKRSRTATASAGAVPEVGTSVQVSQVAGATTPIAPRGRGRRGRGNDGFISFDPSKLKY
ncbi:hypothetical protein EUX98_g5558 [Antrodiella citrinella]|uniref:DNA 3'-5' helicase n=1 Tax=Antrodiella citrinella TaxID=2447956 RepID=A0A4S4MYZ2_9APHY|nr:hypothetical protein EUX98_g5558 [Antrodiella citrinella]